MSILIKSILKNYLATLAIITSTIFLLVYIFLLIDTIQRYSAEVLENINIITITILRCFYFLPNFLSIILFSSSLFFFIKISRVKVLVSYRSMGVSNLQILKPILLCSVIIYLFMYEVYPILDEINSNYLEQKLHKDRLNSTDIVLDKVWSISHSNNTIYILKAQNKEKISAAKYKLKNILLIKVVNGYFIEEIMGSYAISNNNTLTIFNPIVKKKNIKYSIKKFKKIIVPYKANIENESTLLTNTQFLPLTSLIKRVVSQSKSVQPHIIQQYKHDLYKALYSIFPLISMTLLGFYCGAFMSRRKQYILLLNISYIRYFIMMFIQYTAIFITPLNLPMSIVLFFHYSLTFIILCYLIKYYRHSY